MSEDDKELRKACPREGWDYAAHSVAPKAGTVWVTLHPAEAGTLRLKWPQLPLFCSAPRRMTSSEDEAVPY